MQTPFFKKRVFGSVAKQFLCIIVLFSFLVNTFGPIPSAQAQEFHLPVPGVMVHLSPSFDPPLLKGIKVHSDNPFRFDFILDRGDSSEGDLKDEATRLIKYFLASLTIPEKDLWVNLSPYEKDRIVPNSFGFTEMGRDLLAEDYMLKQITASLIYPEDETGKKFWKRIYEEAYRKYRTTNIPVNTFNKVWIIPEKALVFENAKAGTAYVVESKLKVMLEEDYLALEKNQRQPGDMASLDAKASQGTHYPQNINALGSQIVREVVIPELTKEVNEDKNFLKLRQVYNSLILATWYKKKIKDSILAEIYADKKKVAGVGYKDSANIEAIYQRYLKAFKKGVYNYIKEEQDPITQEMIPRKYFSGGFNLAMTADAVMEVKDISKDPAMMNRLINIAGTALVVIGAVLANPVNAKTFTPHEQIPQSQATFSVPAKAMEGLVNQLYDVDPDVAKKSSDQLRTMDPKVVLDFLVDYIKDGRVFQKYQEMLDLKRLAMIKGVEEKIENGQQRALWQEFLSRYLVSGQSLDTSQYTHGLYGWLKGQKDSVDAQRLYRIIQEQETRWLRASFYRELSIIRDMDNEEAKSSLEDLVHDDDLPAEYKEHIAYLQKQHPDMAPKYLLYAALTMVGILSGFLAGIKIAERRYKIPLLSRIAINHELNKIKSRLEAGQSTDRFYDLEKNVGRDILIQDFGLKILKMLSVTGFSLHPNTSPSHLLKDVLINALDVYPLEKKVILPIEDLRNVASNHYLPLEIRLLAIQLLVKVEDSEYLVNVISGLLDNRFLYGSEGIALELVKILVGMKHPAVKDKLRGIAKYDKAWGLRLIAIKGLAIDKREELDILKTALMDFRSTNHDAVKEILEMMADLDIPEAIQYIVSSDNEEASVSLARMTIPEAQVMLGQIAAGQVVSRYDMRLKAIELWSGEENLKLAYARNVVKEKHHSGGLIYVMQSLSKMPDTERFAQEILGEIANDASFYDRDRLHAIGFWRTRQKNESIIDFLRSIAVNSSHRQEISSLDQLEAVHELAKIDGPQAIDALGSISSYCPDFKVRLEAIHEWSFYHHQEAIDLLKDIVLDTNTIHQWLSGGGYGWVPLYSLENRSLAFSALYGMSLLPFGSSAFAAIKEIVSQNDNKEAKNMAVLKLVKNPTAQNIGLIYEQIDNDSLEESTVLEVIQTLPIVAWAIARKLIEQRAVGRTNNILRGVYAARFIISEHQEAERFINRDILSDDSPWLNAAHADFIIGVLDTLRIISDDENLQERVAHIGERTGISADPRFQEILENIRQKNELKSGSSYFGQLVADSVLRGDAIWQGQKVAEELKRITDSLNERNGLQFYIEGTVNGIDMGFYRSVGFNAFTNYLTVGHQISATSYEETYIGVTKEKAFGYGSNDMFLVWIPSQSYNRRVDVKKVKTGHRQGLDELVLDDNLSKEEMRVFFMSSDKLQDEQVRSILSEQKVAVLVKEGDSYRYSTEYGVPGEEIIAGNEQGKARLKEILALHKNMKSNRLVIALDFPNDLFKSRLSNFLSEENSVFAEAFQSNIPDNMKQYSKKRYLSRYIDQHPEVLAHYLQSHVQYVESHVGGVRLETKGSQPGAVVMVDGKEYYAKFYEDEDQMKAEWLSWMIFKEAGIPVVDDVVAARIDNGHGEVKLAILSRWVEGAETPQRPYAPEQLAQEYVASAFIQDRDRGKADNYLQTPQGEILANDFGGSAMFRSTGGIKGEDENNLTFGVNNFLDMLSPTGSHRGKGFYFSIKNREDLIREGMRVFVSRVSLKRLEQMVEAVGLSLPRKNEILNIYGQSYNEMQRQIISDIQANVGLEHISNRTNAVRNVLSQRSGTAQEIWQALKDRLSQFEVFNLIMDADSGRSNWDGENVNLWKHTQDVFEGLDVDSLRRTVNFGPGFSLEAIERLAAVFHDTGKFFEKANQDHFQKAIEQIDQDTGKTRDKETWNDFMRLIESIRNNANPNAHEEISKILLVLYAPLLGYSDPVERALALSVLDNDKMGMMSRSERYGQWQHLGVGEIDQKMSLDSRLVEHFASMGPRNLQKAVLEMSKVLYEADAQISKGIRNQVLEGKGRRWKIKAGAMPKWDEYYRYVELQAIKERALIEFLRGVNSSSSVLTEKDLKRKVSMVAIDFDGTISGRGKDVEEGVLISLRNMLSDGVKVVILSGTDANRIKRKINYDQLSEAQKDNLRIYDKYGTESAMPQDEKQDLVLRIQAIIGSGRIKVREANELKMDIDNLTTNMIKTIADELGEGYRVFVTADKRLHVSRQDKADVLQREVINNNIDPKELLVMGDDMGYFGSDERMANLYKTEALVINLGAPRESNTTTFYLPLDRTFARGGLEVFKAIVGNAVGSDYFIDLQGLRGQDIPVSNRIHKSNIRNSHRLANDNEHNEGLKSAAMIVNKGGIDLTPANMNLQTQSIGGDIKFHIDPAMLEQLRNAPGFTPVIITMQPMTNLRRFMGLEEIKEPLPAA